MLRVAWSPERLIRHVFRCRSRSSRRPSSPRCAPAPEKPEEVPSPDTFECPLEGERWLVRFTDQEARLLTPQGERVNLYQVRTASPACASRTA